MRPKYIRILSDLAHDIDFSSLKHALLHATISEFVSPNCLINHRGVPKIIF